MDSGLFDMVCVGDMVDDSSFNHQEDIFQNHTARVGFADTHIN